MVKQKPSVLMSYSGSVMLLTVSMLCARVNAVPPLPDVQVNGFDDPITLTPNTSVTVTLALDAGDMDGSPADWWLVADTPFGSYYYNVVETMWAPGVVASYQGALADLPGGTPITVAGLPEGQYDFYFGVDTLRNGVVDVANLYFDRVGVTIAPAAVPLSGVNFWAYQIQDVGAPGAVDALANSRYDMLVVEPTRTDWSSDDKSFDTRHMVARLKQTRANDGGHRKLVLAYIDIGEAEDWRWYWQKLGTLSSWNCTGPKPLDWPEWIVKCDPDGWSGNYPVAYWHPSWKDIVIYGQNQNSEPYGGYTSIIDEVIQDGFDGVYLDWVEGYEDKDVAALAAAQGLDSGVEMIRFIEEIRAYAEARVPEFLIIQQNAAALIDVDKSRLLGVIDAIAQEAIAFDGDATDDWNDLNGYDSVNPPSLTQYYLGYLDQYLYNPAGVPVFNCEYAQTHANSAYVGSRVRGYVPYCTRRSLSRLTTTPPPGY